VVSPVSVEHSPQHVHADHVAADPPSGSPRPRPTPSTLTTPTVSLIRVDTPSPFRKQMVLDTVSATVETTVESQLSMIGSEGDL
jgi:hypothetical protein